MEASCQIHAPTALPAEKDLPIYIEQEAGWASEPVWNFPEDRKASCTGRESNP
jgi:hypothetical protein